MAGDNTNSIERIRLANLPTPVEKLNLPEEFKIPQEMYIKRDDLTGCAMSGNKVRKLEYCLAEAKSLGADTVITCGGIQSNHARATAVACAKVGFSCTLVLKGTPPDELDGNTFIDLLCGASIRFITEKEWENVNEIMEEIAEELTISGRRCYIIPEGASYSTGVHGYIEAAREIVEFSRETSIFFDRVVIPVGSGGTYAGLVHGFKIHEYDCNVTGFNVQRSPEYFVKRIVEISNEFVEKLKEGKFKNEQISAIKEDEVDVIGGYDGPEYAVPGEETCRVIRAFARKGIFLDPAYTGKAMQGFLSEAKKGRWREGEKVLFIHTGGIFSLFPWRKKLLEFTG